MIQEKISNAFRKIPGKVHLKTLVLYFDNLSNITPRWILRI